MVKLGKISKKIRKTVENLENGEGGHSVYHKFSLFEALASSEPLIGAIQTAVGCQVQQDVHLQPREVQQMMIGLVLVFL